jgi:iron complex outermembrane recepter protein
MTSLSARTARILRASASTLVLGFASLSPTAAYAQDAVPAAEETKPVSAQTDPEAGTNADATPGEGAGEAETAADGAIIVTGQRRALQTSRNIKRNADTVVDSITATDIGAFPDKSIAEALQRVPGITVNRFAATSDTAHFSAEPSGVIVRGLPQVRSEWNGRDTFSANSGRGLSWNDITPELMAGVDTYKNQTAEMIEGGIAGTINLRTRVPFDATGELIQFGVKANYGDLSKQWTPDLSAFYSNRWSTSIGDVGVMGNVAYSHLTTASQGIQYGRTGIIDAGRFPDSEGTVYVPSQIGFLDNEYDRKRLGIAAAAQWQSLDRNLLVTAQYNRSTNKQQWEERALRAYMFDLYGSDVRYRYANEICNNVRAAIRNQCNEIPVAAPGAPAFTFDEDGNFQSGVFNQGRDITWWGNPAGTPSWGQPGDVFGTPYTAPGFGVNDQGLPMFNTCYTWTVGSGGQQYPGGPLCTTSAYGVSINNASRFNDNKNMTQDFGLNLKWEATDRLRFNFDGQYVDSEIDNYDIEIDFGSFANVAIDASDGRPTMVLTDPTNINQSAGGLANPNNWYIRSVMDHLEHSEGQELALRADGEYDISTDWLDSIKFGARYADRDQKVQWSTYNWHNIANTWTDYSAQCGTHPFFNLDSEARSCGGVEFAGYPDGFFEVADFGASFHGGSFGAMPFVPFEFLRERRASEFSAERIGVGSFIPICERDGQVTPGGDTLPTELDDSCFVEDEISDVSEATKAAYAMLKFGGPDARLGNLGISGNVGLRYVQTIVKSTGALRYPTIQGFNPNDCPPVPLVPGGVTGTDTTPMQPPAGEPPIAPYAAYCYLTPDDLAFNSGGSMPLSARVTHNHWLPSFNLRVDLTPQWLVRFAASKAMSRPDIGLLKNFIGTTASLPEGANLGDPRWIIGDDDLPIGVNPRYVQQAYNPYLKPTTAWQFDISLEHYFGNAGLFSFALFHKQFRNYIQYGSFLVELENNGVTRTTELRGPANGKGAKIQGFEVAYNRFFDFLPDPLNGLGVQANYTYVRNKGISNANLSSVGNTGGDVTNAGNAGTALTPGKLEGLSKHTFNLIGLFEKGPISARVAYNWRSKFLVTAVDCCVYLPVWQKATGFLDASVRYKLTNNFELSLEGSNLLNTKTKLLQQITDEESLEGRNVLTPNAWFQNDRRFIIGARARFGGEAAPPPPPPPVAPAPPPPPPPPATQTCADGSVILQTDVCPVAPPPPPPPPPAPERG